MNTRNKKILVIHPKDRTTDFLKPIYKDLDATVLTGGVGSGMVNRMIEDADKVVMLGHGSPFGLMSVGQFHGAGYIVDDHTADILSEKDNSVFIWCNADQYVKYNKLKGFHTGMFISEKMEANVMGVKNATRYDVYESNKTFADVMSTVVDEEPEMARDIVKSHYGQLAFTNPVARYNSERIYA